MLDKASQNAFATIVKIARYYQPLKADLMNDRALCYSPQSPPAYTGPTKPPSPTTSPDKKIYLNTLMRRYRIDKNDITRLGKDSAWL